MQLYRMSTSAGANYTHKYTQNMLQARNRLEKNLSYDSRFYLHLEKDGEIYYYDIETTISVKLHKALTFPQNITFTLGEIRIKDTCAKTHLFLQNKVDELLRQQNKSFSIGDKNSSSILNNPFCIAIYNSLFNIEAQQESHVKSQLFSDLTVHANFETSESRQNYWISDKKVESTIIRIDNKQFEKELHAHKLELESNKYMFNIKIQNSMFRNKKYPTSISYTQDENLGDKVRLYISVGLKNRNITSGHKLYTKVYSMLKSNISACW